MASVSTRSYLGLPANWRDAVTVGALTLGGLAYFSYIAVVFFLDHDEGFYAMAGRMLADGLVPYRDFFYPQMPYTALLYGAWGSLFGFSMLSLRLCHALINTITTMLVAHAVVRRASPSMAVASVLLFWSHCLTYENLAPVKTHGPTVAALVGAIVMVVAPFRWFEERVTLRWLLVGTLAGIGVGLRLTVAPATVLLLFAPLLAPEVPWRTRGRQAATAVGGFVAALVPAAVTWILAPSSFVFGNVGYHAIRREPGHGLIGNFDQKWGILEEAAGLFHPVDHNPTGVQNIVLWGLTLASVAGLWRRARPELAVWLAFLALIVVAVLPTPTFVQYFVLAVPVACVLAPRALDDSRRGPVLLGTFAVLSVLLGYPGFKERVVDGRRAQWDVSMYRPRDIDAASRTLCAAAPPEAKTAAYWPVYLVACDRPYHPAATNQFMFPVASQMTEAQRRARHVHEAREMRKAALSGEVGAFAFGRFAKGGRRHFTFRLRRIGWKRVPFDGAVQIWVAPGPAHGKTPQ